MKNENQNFIQWTLQSRSMKKPWFAYPIFRNNLKKFFCSKARIFPWRFLSQKLMSFLTSCCDKLFEICENRINILIDETKDFELP